MTTLNTFNKTIVKLITGAGALVLMAGLSLIMVSQAFATDCLLDTNNDGNADNNVDTDGAAYSDGNDSRLACGFGASATGTFSTALGRDSSAAGFGSTALGRSASAAEDDSTALGALAETDLEGTTSVGYAANFNIAVGAYSTALGNSAQTQGTNGIAIGADTGDSGSIGASAAGDDSIVIGADASDGGFAGVVVMGKDALATEAAQIILRSADVFTILGNGNMGLGTALPQEKIHIVSGLPAIRFEDNDGATQDWEIFANTTQMGFQDVTNSFKIPFAVKVGAPSNALIVESNGDVGIGTSAPLANLDINSGAADTTLLLNNKSAQWELKSKASTGRLNFKNLTDGGVPFKLGPSAVNSLLSVGTMADDLVEVRGELMVEGNVDVTGTLTTGGPTCGGGCDAVFGADYDLPTIEEHAAEMYANSYLPQVGPTVPHAPMNISEKVGTMLNELEKAHIYIAQIQARHEAERRVMRSEMEQTKTRLVRLEALLIK